MSYIKRRRKNVGEFIPKTPGKYIGEYPILVRSSWERMFFQWCDRNNAVKKWASENIAIPYYDPTTLHHGKPALRRYYPDVYMEVGGKRYLVEIKPLRETRPPRRGKKSANTLMERTIRYKRNAAKFKAASAYCKKLGMEFKVLTEKELFN
jgi:hypothetical protein